MSPFHLARILRRDPLLAAAVAASVVCLSALALAVAGRVTHPLELEWMEDGALQHARWIAAGNPVYPPPSADFVPYLYTPLFPLILAVVGAVVPLDLLTGRAVSIVAAVFLFAAIHRAVTEEGRPAAHGLLAMGLFASSYVLTYRWLDLARADTLMLALAAWGAVRTRTAPEGTGKAAVAGLLLALAFWAKQTAFILVLAAGIAALLAGRRRLWVVVLTAGLVGGVGVLLGNLWSEGWMWTYIYEMHQAHPFNMARFTRKSWGILLHGMPFAAAAAGLSLAAAFGPLLGRTRRLAPDRTRRAALWSARSGVVFWGVLAAGGLLASALGYSTLWAEANAFLPAAAFCAIFVGVALPERGRYRRPAVGLVGAQVLFGLLVEPVFQPIWDHGLSALPRSYRLQEVGRTVPGSAVRKRAVRLRAELEREPVPVFALHRPWWNVLSGGEGHVGAMGLHDVDPATRREIRAELRRRIRSGVYGAVWTDDEPPGFVRAALRGVYRMTDRRTGRARVLPMTGYLSEAGMVVPHRGPQYRFDKVAPRLPPPGARVVADFETGAVAPMVREGAAFPPRAQRLFEGRMPAFGPHGGAYFLCSSPPSHRPRLSGRIRGPLLDLGVRQWVRLHVAVEGTAAAVEVRLEDPAGAVAAATAPAGPPHVFVALDLVPPAPGRYRVVVEDRGPDAVVCVDDIWVMSKADAPVQTPGPRPGGG